MCIISHLTLTIVDWLRNKENKKMLYIFRRVPAKSPEAGRGKWSFLRMLRDHRESVPPSSPPHIVTQCDCYMNKIRVN